MEKLILFQLDYSPNEKIYIEYNKNNFFEGICDFCTKIINKEAQKKLKDFGINVEKFYKEKKALDIENLNLNEEARDKVESILSNLDCLPTVHPGYSCDDMHSKKDLEKLDDDIFLKDINGYIGTKMEMLFDWDYYTCYYYKKGHNYICDTIKSMKEIEVKKANNEEYEKENSKNYGYRKTYHYDYYKTIDNKLFRVLVKSHYQKGLDSVDETFGDWDKISKELK